MNVITGDLWDYMGKGWIVVPINLGVTTHMGVATMRTGVAAQARMRYPFVPYLVYHLLVQGGQSQQVYVLYATGLPLMGGLIFCPTRTDWHAHATVDLVEASVIALARLPLDGLIYLPLLGCGYGRLEETRVMPILKRNCSHERFTLVRRGPEVYERHKPTFRTLYGEDNRRYPYDRSLMDEQKNATAC